MQKVIAMMFLSLLFAGCKLGGGGGGSTPDSATGTTSSPTAYSQDAAVTGDTVYTPAVVQDTGAGGEVSGGGTFHNPEPNTILLLTVGLGGLLAVKKLRKSKKKS